MSQQLFLKQISEAFSGPATTDQLIGLAIFGLVVFGFVISNVLYHYAEDKNSPWDSRW